MTRGNMSPLNRGPLLGPRIPPAGVRPLPHPRFGAIFPPGMPPRMPLPPMSGILGPMRPRLPPPPRIGGVAQPGGPRPLLPPGRAPLPPIPGPRGPLMCPWPRRVLPPQMVPHMRPRFSPRNGSNKGKPVNTVKKVVKFEAHFEPNMETKEPNKESSDKINENNERINVDKKYYCEVCDREYKTEEKLVEHVTMHKLCGIDGCTFTANDLLVEKHIKMQHRTGLYERMKNVSTPEDIQKWIEERKRKYPTKANIEEKQKVELKKIECGEIVRQMNKAIHSRKNNQQTNTNIVKKQKRKWRIPKDQNIILPVTETYRGLTQFSGTSCLKQDDFNESENINKEHLEIKCINEIKEIENSFNISDEEDALVENNPMTNPIKNTSMCSLVADYESEEEDGPEEIPIKKLASYSNETNIIEDKILNSEQSTKNCNVLSDTVLNNAKSDKKKRKKEKENKPFSIQNRVISKQKNYRNSSSLNLLRKLLARPIKHERNLIYQCIKYIASNNFFVLKNDINL